MIWARLLPHINHSHTNMRSPYDFPGLNLHSVCCRVLSVLPDHPFAAIIITLTVLTLYLPYVPVNAVLR